VRAHRHKDVTKVSPNDVTKCAEPVFSEQQLELLGIGQSISYQRVILASSWGGVHIKPGEAGWTEYALTNTERLNIVIPRLRIYASHLIDVGLAGEA